MNEINLDAKIEEAFVELEQMAQDFAQPQNTPGYEGVWLPPDNMVRMWTIPRSTGELLYEMILEKKPQVILELGTSSGYSAIWMAAAARTYDGHVFTVEMAQPKIDIAQAYFDKIGFSNDITILNGEVATVLETWDRPTDFVFMDADKHNYLSYMKQLEESLTDDAVVVADNAIDFGHMMEDYIAYMQSTPHFNTELLEQDNGLLVSKKLPA